MPEKMIVRGDGITVDLLLWRRYGRAGQALLAATLHLNPGLARLGTLLPPGTALTLPDPPAQRPVRTVVDLFGG